MNLNGGLFRHLIMIGQAIESYFIDMRFGTRLSEFTVSLPNPMMVSSAEIFFIALTRTIKGSYI